MLDNAAMHCSRGTGGLSASKQIRMINVSFRIHAQMWSICAPHFEVSGEAVEALLMHSAEA